MKKITLLKLVRIACFMFAAYIANAFVGLLSGGVNPFVEFSFGGITRVDTRDSRNSEPLFLAYQACRNSLEPEDSGQIEFPDERYQAWNLYDGNYLLKTRIYQYQSGHPEFGTMMCRVHQYEDEVSLQMKWEVSGIQISLI